MKLAIGRFGEKRFDGLVEGEVGRMVYLDESE